MEDKENKKKESSLLTTYMPVISEKAEKELSSRKRTAPQMTKESTKISAKKPTPANEMKYRKLSDFFAKKAS